MAKLQNLFDLNVKVVYIVSLYGKVVSMIHRNGHCARHFHMDK